MPSEHGTPARYNAGCRCDACRAVMAAYHRHRQERLRAERRAGAAYHRALLGIASGVIAPDVAVELARRTLAIAPWPSADYPPSGGRDDHQRRATMRP